MIRIIAILSIFLSVVVSLNGKDESARRRSIITIEDHPYVVALYDSVGNFACPGTIIAPKIVLTANHCVSPYRLFSIRAKSSDISSGGEKYRIQRIIKYPNASRNGSPVPHDIALVVLKTKIPNVRPVKLADPKVEVPPGAIVQALGWGSRDFPRILSKVDLEITSRQDCLMYYKSDDWFCTESYNTYTCAGDGGGPVIFSGEQVGIVSHSKNDNSCSSRLPTANVNLRKYSAWIKSKIRLHA
ncbi:hypothetical protein QAD02_022725 [Eretmocerus hayati]|uniref:Uncharacterized protein n=1 Tax=Eretmocerus hayati TaxID=131215 RepID=A0ACC2PTS5_9HYME|nr:hypothetical protein QAD02_022725 [Eretmocerus hayati]